ncbi:hypothetical protein [Dokdonella sp.]|uniref:hypothetical protein n=1 Tax=Dokdonella sp. TaxID=2291710 RepID=UPI0035292EB6
MTTPAFAASSVHGTMEGDTYVAPMGDYRCQIPNFDSRDIKLDEGFGKAGGTAAFISFLNITRVDVEKVEIGVPATEMTPELVRELHTFYFQEQVVPLVKAGVKDASIVSKDYQSKAPTTYRSVMKLPMGKRKGGDMMRASIQYTNGDFMYVVSVSRYMKPERGWSEAQDAEELMKEAERAFARCQFPPIPTGNSEPVT